MAGFICISKIGVSMSTVSFDIITAWTKRYFKPADESTIHILYDDFEKGDIPAFYLDEFSFYVFMSFYSACYKAYEEFRSLYERRNLSWEEVLEELRKDPRFSKNKA